MNKLLNIEKGPIYSLGLMSGTSLDGVDVALVEHTLNNDEEVHTLLKFLSYPYDEALKNKILRNSNDETSKISEICELNKELGIAYRDAITKFLKDASVDIATISFIAIHGQTIYHIPNNPIPKTLQLGDMSEVAYNFNKTVVYDFRSLDTAAFGGGAPLVPIVNFTLFKHKAPVMLLNIGGISNITYIKNQDLASVMAFDTGPGNMLIDSLMQKLYQKSFDEDGKIALSGRVSEDLIKWLLADDYYEAKPPKSTGREKYNNSLVEAILNKQKELKISNQDIISTVTYFTALTINLAIERFIKTKDYSLIISGGGAHNEAIIKALKEFKYQVVISDDSFSDGLEAYSFAILGYLRLTNQFANIPNVTGAKELVKLGSIILPPKGDKND